ncbi:tyrosine-type recombinase/integrase [Burkholderia ubonensis]|uniref:tyrosine-type recombinase/integrase n=1 Tax=Burkholderia ubonensis TaxID=101571 RepID=UPI000A4ABDDD
MRDDLVAAALRDGSPVLVAHLQASIAKHGEPRRTPVSLQMIEQVAGARAAAAPAAEHPVGSSFRPLVASRMAGEGNRYASQGAPQRAYRRALERFLPSAIVERGVALSSLRVEDCDAYKAFLVVPADAFCGPPASRASRRWRSFAPGGLSLESQRYAVRTLRAAFEWLVKVRYLTCNPWAAVTDPKPVKRARKLQIERALPFELMGAHTHAPRGVEHRLRPGCAALAGRSRAAAVDGRRGSAHRRGGRGRAARARAACGRRRDPGDLGAARDRQEQQGALRAGQRRVRRRAARALARSRTGSRCARRVGAAGAAADCAAGDSADAARAKFAADGVEADAVPAARAGGYSVRGARGLVRWAVVQLLAQLADLTEAERRQLARLSPQAFRHTFGMQSVGTDMPLDVVQHLLGHASLQTISVYVTAEKKRRRHELVTYHARLAGDG